MWSLRLLYTFVLRAQKRYHISKCGNAFPRVIQKYFCIFHILRYFSSKLHNFTKFMMLFPAVLMNFPNSKVCLIWEWSNNNICFLGPVYMKLGRYQTDMKIEIVSMFTWDWYENHKSFYLFPLPAIVVFYRALSSMRNCHFEADSPAKTGLKCICVHIHPALDSSRFENSQLSPEGEMTSDRDEHFLSRSHVNIYYK